MQSNGDRQNTLPSNYHTKNNGRWLPGAWSPGRPPEPPDNWLDTTRSCLKPLEPLIILLQNRPGRSCVLGAPAELGLRIAVGPVGLHLAGVRQAFSGRLASLALLGQVLGRLLHDAVVDGRNRIVEAEAKVVVLQQVPDAQQVTANWDRKTRAGAVNDHGGL